MTLCTDRAVSQAPRRPAGVSKHFLQPLQSLPNILSQIQVPSSQVLPRPSTPSPASQSLRCVLARVHSRSLLPATPPTNLRLHPRIRSHDLGLRPPPTRLRRTTKRRAPPIMAGRITILQKPSFAWTQRWRRAETSEGPNHFPQCAQD